MEDDLEFSLLCDENLSETGSPSPQQPPSLPPVTAASSSSSSISSALVSFEDRENDIKILFQTQSDYLPSPGYAARLLRLPRLGALRCNAVVWIVMTCAQCNLCYGTLFSSVNYLDRFVSIFLDKEWEDWMMELVSVACLSISTKFSEVAVPPMHAFQLPINFFDSTTIQRMEFLILDALRWRLHCVTAHSYIHLLHQNASAHFTANTCDLLLRSLLDVRFLNHKPFDVAAAAVKCTATELAGASDFLDILAKPHQNEDDMKQCYEMMMKRAREPMPSSTSTTGFGVPFSPAAMFKPSSMGMPMSERVLRLDSFFIDSDKNDVDDIDKKKKKRRV